MKRKTKSRKRGDWNLLFAVVAAMLLFSLVVRANLLHFNFGESQSAAAPALTAAELVGRSLNE